jgi:hypothetical protein
MGFGLDLWYNLRNSREHRTGQEDKTGIRSFGQGEGEGKKKWGSCSAFS